MTQETSLKSSGAASLAAREILIAKFIPYTRHVDGETICTKDGYLLQVIELDGIPFETADQADLNAGKDIRSTLWRGIANSRFAIYHHIIRSGTKPHLDGDFDNDWCRQLDQEYQSRLSKRRMYENRQFITIVRRPPQSPIGMASQIGRNLFHKVDAKARAGQEEQDLKALRNAVIQVVSALGAYRPRVLSTFEKESEIYSEPLAFLSRLININTGDIKLPAVDLAEYLPQKRLSFGKESFEIRGAAADDVHLGAMLSIKDYPDSTGAGMLDILMRLPHEFIVTQSFGFVERQAALSKMQDRRRKTISADEGAASLEEDFDIAIDQLASGKSCFGEHHLSVCVLGQSAPELDRAISDTVSAFVNLGIVAVREDLNMESSFWAQLPGNFSYIARRAMISNQNFAGFASFHDFPGGKKAKPHWGQPVSLLETTSGTPYFFNFHARDVGNFTLIGPTGAGKTVLLTFLLAQAQRFAPRSIYFDKDNGAEIFIRAIGGEYTNIKSGQATGLNPLKMEDTPDNRAFLRDWLRMLAELDADGAPTLSAEDLAQIKDAVDANFSVDPEYRTLSNLVTLLAGHEKSHSYSLTSRLSQWHGNGSRAWLFDNPEDTLSLNNRTIGFDLTSILDDRISRTPWLSYIFHRISQSLNGEKTIIMLDEGWKLLDDDIFASRIKDWMKAIRKLNGIVGFATQSVSDALNSKIRDAIIEQSPTQIFLPNHKAAREGYCKGFGLTPAEFDVIRKATPESRCFLVKSGTDSIVARLDLSGMDDTLAILSGRTSSLNIMRGLIREQGAEPEHWLQELILMCRELGGRG